MSITVHSSYLHPAFHPKAMQFVTRHFLNLIKSKNLEFDAIAFRGMSGALMAPIVALNLGKSLLIVRKQGESSHSSHRVEGYRGNGNFIIVDDFVSSGDTITQILNSLLLFLNCPAPEKCVGVFTWKSARSTSSQGAPYVFDAKYCQNNVLKSIPLNVWGMTVDAASDGTPILYDYDGYDKEQLALGTHRGNPNVIYEP